MPRKAPFIVVRRRPGKPTQGLLQIGSSVYVCALGRGGISTVKREGDGATPLAEMRPRRIFFRHNRKTAMRLPATPIADNLGWCDDPLDANYNCLVRLPFHAGHERMWREDSLYDFCIVLDWNMRPRLRGRGSAIFLHLMRSDAAPTEGCIAVTPQVMSRLLPLLSHDSRIRVLR